MSRLSLWKIASLAGILLVGCGADEQPVEGYRPSADGPAHADTTSEPPYGSGTEVGQTYDYVMYTHCGIEWTRIDGVWWRTADPLNDGNANPPSGWGNPYDDGELHIVDEDTAVYRGGPDAEVEFARTDTVEAPFACD
jgi:hypothetical protein